LRKCLLLCAAAVLAAPAAPAFAQTPANVPAKAPAKPAAGTVEGVTVTGTAPPLRTAIDRKSYSVTNDLQATTGSISDALRNVPSVEVDLQGNVSLRGDQNVTIMIDGKPSGMFRGEGKGQALQSLPADQIERVEVITNPSAEFKPEGTGGIINLITKKSHKAGVTGSVRANIGTSSRGNGGISGAYAGRAFTLSGDASYRRDSFHQDYADGRQTFDPVLGGFRGLDDDIRSHGKVDIVTGRAGLDYDPDAKTHAGGQLRYQGVDFHNHLVEDIDRTLPGGATDTAYTRLITNSQRRRDVEGTVNYSYKFGDDHEFAASATEEWQTDHRQRPALAQFSVPALPDAFDEIQVHNTFWRTEAKASYATPLPGEAKLKLGYEYDEDDNDYGNAGLRGPSAARRSLDPSLINLFNFDQRIHSLWTTYERPVGKLTVLAGLRLESVRIDLDQITQNRQAKNEYDRAYPSLHLAYKLNEAQQLTASASRRVQRPQPYDFNPFLQYLDPQNYRQGNPGLKPQQTDSYELGYQYRRNGTILLATLYYRDGKDAVNDLTRDIGGGVFLTTRANIGGFRNAGVELVANGRLPHRLSYNVSSNLLWSEIDAAGLGFGARDRSAYSVSGRASLSWQATPKDFFQVSGFVNGRRLAPQGYARPFGMLNLGYRRKLDDQLSFVMTVQDAAKTFHDYRVIDAPTLKDVVRVHGNFRAVFVGFSYSFGGGGGKAKDPGFDFGQGGGPPG
jgi:outer membrane receptor protein involved in Fe transport